MKPITEAMKMNLMPNRPASQPVSGIAIAEATMYEVRTQEIWSCAADMLPWMCGSATLAIVVSIPCSTQAQITVAVIMPRLIGGPAGAIERSLLMPLASIVRYGSGGNRGRRRGPHR